MLLDFIRKKSALHLNSLVFIFFLFKAVDSWNVILAPISTTPTNEPLLS